MSVVAVAGPVAATMPEVSWEIAEPGAFTRQFRFGEWIGEPVTPLFESWLLTMMENTLHDTLRRLIGQKAPGPLHVVVNGWYFYSLNWASPSTMLRNLPSLVLHALRDPRRVAGLIPPTVRHSVPVFERDWREDLLPRYRAAVASAESRVETLPISDLPPLIDELASLAGEYFTSIAALSGAGYKLEINLARFYGRHLAPTLGGSHLPLLTGFDAPAGPPPHAVTSLDWWYEIGTRTHGSMPTEAHTKLVATRRAAEATALAALVASPGRTRAFRRLLADAQHMVPLREAQVAELTLPWPVMRRAVIRIGEALAASGQIADPDDVFFLTRTEVLAALADKPITVDTIARRATRDQQAALSPPLLVGRINRGLKAMFDSFPRMIGARRSQAALVSGSPASGGRATGRVRVVHGPHEFDTLQEGEILVAPVTAPAWTPLFTLAAAVVTDVGSVAAHASVIAREYGIPAVVGCGDATSKLRTGMLVTVDGSAGNVEPA